MPPGLKRYQHTGQFHFITFSGYRRKPLLASPEAKDRFEHILEEIRAQQGLLVIAYVLMPEHVHLLTDEPACCTLATFLQILKQRTSRHLATGREHPLWQRRYDDRNVRTHEEAIHTINYIHQNPVKRGLAAQPEHYPWSSALQDTTGTRAKLHLHRL